MGINTGGLKIDNDLIKLFISAKNGDEQAVEEIYIRFHKLIKKFARISNYEEAETDITIFLIIFIKTINITKINNMSKDEFINYIYKSLKNHTLNLILKNKNIFHADYSLDVDIKYYDDDYEELEFISKYVSSEKLTSIQKRILIGLYLYNYKVSELAKLFNVSRQAINQNKLKALEIIKSEITNKGED